MKTRRYVKSADFKDSFKKGEEVGDLILRKQFVDEVEKEKEDLTLSLTISSGIADRDNDVVSLDGWDLENYKKNPVVLFGHNGSQLPIARSKSLYKYQGKFKSKAEFTPRDVNSFGHMVYQMYANGFMKATSVGFMPKQWDWTKDESRPMGIDFAKQELLEWSAVPVPANPEALIEAHAAGIDTQPLKAWAEEILDLGKELPGFTRDQLEKAWRTAEYLLGTKTISIPEKQTVNKPDPANYDSESEFMSACVPMMTDEGRDHDQAVAACLNMWRQHHESAAPKIELKLINELGVEFDSIIPEITKKDGILVITASLKPKPECKHPKLLVITSGEGGLNFTCESCAKVVQTFTQNKETGALTVAQTVVEEKDLYIELEKDEPTPVPDDDPELTVEKGDILSLIREVASEELAKQFGRLPK